MPGVRLHPSTALWAASAVFYIEHQCRTPSHQSRATSAGSSTFAFIRGQAQKRVKKVHKFTCFYINAQERTSIRINSRVFHNFNGFLAQNLLWQPRIFLDYSPLTDDQGPTSNDCPWEAGNRRWLVAESVAEVLQWLFGC